MSVSSWRKVSYLLFLPPRPLPRTQPRSRREDVLIVLFPWVEVSRTVQPDTASAWEGTAVMCSIAWNPPHAKARQTQPLPLEFTGVISFQMLLPVLCFPLQLSAVLSLLPLNLEFLSLWGLEQKWYLRKKLFNLPVHPWHAKILCLKC